jgi:arylsulfatase A-like enzyme
MFLEVAAGPVWYRADPAPLARIAPSLRRVVWLVFEELDQRLTFEARPTGVELPEFDRLRREALYADAARPPAGTTDVSMPALITGRPVVAVAPTSPNDLELTFADGPAAPWRAQPNVFSRARALGYDTALIGWQLPYPRVLGASLGAAAWRPSVAHEQARGDTIGQALWNQWGSLAPPAHARRLLVQRFAELDDVALRTATDGRFGLVLLHLPVPRSPGIYDRATGRLTTWNFTGADGGYLDNLALADHVIGKLRRGIERARLGDRTWIVVSSDHWWRASRRDDQTMDHRVPFLVRPPSGGRTTHVDAAFNTLAAHDLVLAILRGSLSDTGDAATWLSRQTAPPPKAYTSEGRPIY